MYLPAIMAFLHHLAAFTVVSCLVAEIVLLKPPLSVAQARRIQRTDVLFGISSGVVLAVGVLRMLYFEKGAGYYLSDAFFLTKFVAFMLAGFISIYPTVLFQSWSKALKQGIAPDIPAAQLRRARMCLMWETTAIVVILFCAAFMARGLGYFGH
jgi:putative membrane protein